MSVVRQYHPQRTLLPRGQLVRRTLRRDPTQEYILYIPSAWSSDIPESILVSVHGVSRNAINQAKYFAQYCEAYNTMLVVPFFSKKLHDDYQRLGRRGRGIRADLALNACLEEVSLLTNVDITSFSLFGFSGGAQFAHRYAMAHPHRIRSAVVVAAGWYTFPDNVQRYPYGLRNPKLVPAIEFNAEEFLAVPIEVVVGQEDTGVKNLRSTERVVSQQGTTRIERGERWTQAMANCARQYGAPSKVGYTLIPEANHAFASFATVQDFSLVVQAKLFSSSGLEIADVERALNLAVETN